MPAAPGRTGAWKCCTLSSMGRWTRTPVGSALRRVPWVRCGGVPIASSPTCAARCRSDGLPSACGPIRRGCWRSAQPADSQRINLKCHAPALTPALAEDSPQHVAVTLLHINDVYEIAPRKGLGGFAGLATLLKRERERAARGQVITTVGGDFLSPSVMSGLTKGAQMIDLFNVVGVDYVTF